DLHPKRLVAFQNPRQNFFAGLDQSLGPARLLSFECGHFDGQLGGALDILTIDEFPSFELRTIGKISVFGERVVLPATCIIDGLAGPDASGPVEIEEDLMAGTAGVLKNEMTVEQNGFDFR